MKYAFIAAHTVEFAVGVMCQALQVSTSGYYAWRHHAPSRRTQADAARVAHIQTAFVAGRGV
jgi:putative transposase